MEEERSFNYRLSCASHTIENTFGILAAKFRIYRRPIKTNISLCEKIEKDRDRDREDREDSKSNYLFT